MSRPLRVFCRKSAGKTRGKTDVWKLTLESGRCGVCWIQLCPVHTRCVFRRQNNAAGVRKTDIPLRAFSPYAKNCGRPFKMLFFHHGGLEKRTGVTVSLSAPKTPFYCKNIHIPFGVRIFSGRRQVRCVFKICFSPLNIFCRSLTQFPSFKLFYRPERRLRRLPSPIPTARSQQPPTQLLPPLPLWIKADSPLRFRQYRLS